MAGAPQTPLTLVSAPAGSGKSVVVSQWLLESGYDDVWISLGAGESDLRLFLTYLLTGIQDRRPEACAETTGILVSGVLPQAEVVARCLANDLDRLDEPLVVVLDDYHLVSFSSGVHEVLDRLLQRPPLPLRLVICTRKEPPLGLFKLRAAGQMTELRLRDLRFSLDESAALLEKSKGVRVSREALENLDRELEGWAAGLRLVLSSLGRGAADEAFVMGLRGGVQQAREYLLKEVLAALPAGTSRLLILSSIYDQFSADALDALVADGTATESLDGRDLLTTLQEGNLFAIPLDSEGVWVRYHHLFREMLQLELERGHSEPEIAALHRRAGEWLESQGRIDDALGHLLAAGEQLAAAEVIERHRMEEFNCDRWFVVKRWLRLLPEDVVQQRPALLLSRASVLREIFQFTQAAVVTDRVEELLGDRNESALRGELDFLKGGMKAFLSCEGSAATKLLESAREHLPLEAVSFRARLDLDSAVAAVLTGRGPEWAERIQAELLEVGPSHPMRRAGLLIAQTVVNLLMGDARAASWSAKQLTARVAETGSASKEGWAHYLLAQSHLHMLEWSEALTAFSVTGSLIRGVSRRLFLDALAGQAYACEALSRPGDTDAVLSEMKELTRGAESKSTAISDSCEARIALLRGELGAATAWAESFRTEIDPSGIMFIFDVSAMTQARVWIALGGRSHLRRAQARLDALSSTVSALHFASQQVELDVLQAVVFEKSKRRQEALEVLAPVVERAVPRGWLRPFAEAQPILEELLEILAGHGSEHDATHRLLRALRTHPTGAGGTAAGSGQEPVAARRPVQAAPDGEALTNRELDVLELLALRLHDKEIAIRLGISAYTVKDHLKHLYQKLGVRGRRAAVARARSLGLLESSSGQSHP